MSEEKILSILKKNAYQVEFGSAGKGLTELQKEAIEALNLPGIDFITTHKRYYPNNTFLSYIIGYTKEDENGQITGEMGIEKEYNDYLNNMIDTDRKDKLVKFGVFKYSDYDIVKNDFKELTKSIKTKK